MRSALLLLGLVAGCAATQQPYRFSAPATSEAAVAAVVRALAQNGLTTTAVDPRAGVVHTQWQDTGFMYGQVGNATATIVRRYIVTLSPSATGSDIQVRADTQRCAQGSFATDGAGALQAGCEAMNGLVPKHQQELDALGAQLRSALGGAAAATPAPSAG